MTTERKGLSKKVRFEVFKRDSFTCQYCGKQPPDVVLHVDHINPVASGGDNDPLNLITSCQDCNLGKSATPLENAPNKPDANLELLEMQQEIMELKQYQEAKKTRDELTRSIIEGLQELWWETVNSDDAPIDNQFHTWLKYASPNEIEDAIRITSNKKSAWQYTQRYYKIENQIKYCSGVLRNITGNSRE
jgi:hypothetical protein